MKRRLQPQALPGRNNPCITCPPIEATLGMRRRIAVGFGFAAVLCDGAIVWCEPPLANWEDCWTVQRAEHRAQKAPHQDWRIRLAGPLHGETYQRQGDKRWVLIESNRGFA